MPRKHNPYGDEIEFGSESFLDVIANIVGILVILIVVAGLRVKHAPANVAIDASQFDAERLATFKEQSDVIETANRAAKHAEQVAWTAYHEELARRTAADETVKAGQARQQQSVASRRQEIERLQKRQAELDDVARRWQENIASLEAILVSEKRTVAGALTESAGLRAKESELERQRRLLEENRKFWESHARRLETDEKTLTAEIADKRVQLAAFERSDAPVKTLVHFSSPISLPVSKKEMHFRVEAGQVDRVPLDELIDRVRLELALRDLKSATVFDGVAGPIEGFRLRYSFVAASSSLSEIMANGSQRLELVSFEVLPPTEDKRDAIAAALESDSKLSKRLKDCPPDRYAITLWVYPNSFGSVKELQTRFHEDGYIVALRPLPPGAPISGSPNGTASRGQ